MTTAPTLTPKQTRFVEEYLIDLHVTKAAERAGYAARSAYSSGHRLLTNAGIARAIADARAKLSARTEITAERVLDAYARITFGRIFRFLRIDVDGQPVVDLARCTPADLDILAEIVIETNADRAEDGAVVRRIRVKPLDKLRALDALARHLGLFDEMVQVETGDRLTQLLHEISRRGSKISIN